MKKILFASILASLMLISCTSEQSQIIAHRGWWKHEGSAQNSITSLRLAQQAGFYASEMDTQMTKDSIMIVFHDSRIHGKYVSRMTYAEVLADTTLVNGEQVSTLAEYIKTFASDQKSPTKLIVELKKQEHNDSAWMTTTSRKTVEIINSFDIPADKLEFISFSFFACQELKRNAPERKVAYLNGDVKPADIKAAGLDGIDYYYDVFYQHPEYAEECKALGLTTNTWTVDFRGTAEDMNRLGLDYITTNYPDKRYK